MTRQLPIVGYRNLLTEGTTEATTNNDKRSLAYNGLTYDAWPIEAGLQYLTVTHTSARACDYFAFSRHNLHTVAGRVRLEGWDGAAWIAVTDWIYPDGKAQMVAFDSVTHEQYRVAVDSPLPCYIGVIYFGQRLTLIRGVGEGSIPSRQARDTEIIGVNSEGGQTLGRSLVRRAVRFPLLSRNYEPAWMRTEGQDFISHAERKGFFYAFDLGENPTDVVFVEAVPIDQPAFVDAYRQNISMECGGPLDDGERVPEQVQGLTVTPGGADLVLSWDAVTGADSYNVYRATDEAGPYTLIGSSLAAGFTDDPPLPLTEYFYTVAAVVADVVGVQSESVSGITLSFVKDSFNRADAATVGTADSGQAWTTRAGTCGISGNRFEVKVAGYATIPSDLADSHISVKVYVSFSAFPIYGVYFRWSDPDNYWWLEGGATTFQLRKVVAGVDTEVESVSGLAVANGDTISVRLDGQVITAYQNGDLRLSYTDTDSFNIGATVVGLGEPNSAGPEFDDLEVIAI